jgi:hypothetical protein
LHACCSGTNRFDDAESNIQLYNWYPGNKEGKGGVFNFVLKEESARKNAKFLDTSRNRFSYNLEISSCYIKGDIQQENFIHGVTNNFQQGN